MHRLIILGSGGHSKVVIDIVKQNSEYKLVGLIDNNIGDSILNVPVIGNDNDLDKLFEDGIKHAFVAIGSIKVREKLMMKLDAIGFSIINVISNKAIISESVKVGRGNLIMPGAIINACSEIKDGCIINTNSSVDHDCIIGSYTHIAPGCAIAGSVRIGDRCFLGVGSRVIDGIKLEDETIVGAGTTIIENIEGYSTVVGTPGRIIKRSR